MYIEFFSTPNGGFGRLQHDTFFLECMIGCIMVVTGENHANGSLVAFSPLIFIPNPKNGGVLYKTKYHAIEIIVMLQDGYAKDISVKQHKPFGVF